jgi:hypothetical protein
MTTRPVETHELRPFFVYVGLGVFLLALAWIAAGCTGTTDQTKGAGMPQFDAAPVAISGQLELSNGTVVDLALGNIVAGGEGLFVRRLDVDVSGGVLMDGKPQTAAVEWRSSQLGEVWTRCALTTFDVLQWRVQVRPPLSQACGTPGLVEVRYLPFRDAPAADAR